MKKAFEQNVSRARPRLKLGSLLEDAPSPEAAELKEEPQLPAAVAPAPPPQRAPPPEAPQPVQKPALSKGGGEASLPQAASGRRGAEAVADMLARHAASASLPKASPHPAERTALASPPPEEDVSVRRERLRQRLKAAREQPRPAPLPATAAAAGVLAVERIAALQSELAEVRALNLGLVQELEASRRHAERAAEEARLRVDEAKRLATEVEGRTKLLSDLEKELAALEGERDEMLLAVQDLRAREEANAQEHLRLSAALADKDRQLSDGLAEEERLAGEVESYREELEALRRTVQALTTEQQLLARQVAELTAERAELLEARKALEAVHRALSEAVSR